MTLQQYLVEGGDGQVANAANMQAERVVLDGGTAQFSSAKAFSGSTGVKIVSTVNKLCIARFYAAEPSMTMAATFGITMPEADVSMWTSVAALSGAGGAACYFVYTPDRRVAIQDRTRSITQYLATNVSPGAKIRIAIRLIVGTATTGQYQVNVYSGQSTTPLNQTVIQSTVSNLGTGPIAYGDFGVLSVNIPEAIAVGFDDIQFNDGSIVEIAAVNGGSEPVAISADLVWTGGEWR